MDNATLDHAVEVARALRPEEQRQLRALIDSWQTETLEETLVETTPEQEIAFLEHLLAKGIISHIPSGQRLSPDPEPITVQGEPVSETIIRERR